MKKLLYVLNDGMRKFTYEWIAGLYRAIERAEEDINLYIVRADGYSGFVPAHNQGEYNIFRLPDYSDFDGILLDVYTAFSTDGDDPTARGIRDAVRAAADSGKPVISMANYIEGLRYVGIDNYSAMTSVIEHLHQVMGLHDFWFAMGSGDSSENDMRTRALTDYCAAHGIPCEADRFYAESFLMESGLHAFEHFRGLHGDKLPQAVICANDQIALGICQAAAAAGLAVPRDFMVTGFDNLDISAYLSPSITTVDQQCWTMGDACVDAMCRIWRGEDVPRAVYTPTQLLLRETTGHADALPTDIKQHVTQFIGRDASATEFGYKLSTLQYQLPSCASIREICAALTECLSAMNCKGIRLVLDRKLLEFGGMIDFNAPIDQLDVAKRLPTEGYSDSMERVYAWSVNKKARFTRRRVENPLFTDTLGEARGNFLFAPLHFREYTVGYLAIWNCIDLMHIKCVSSIINTLTMALRSYFARRDLTYVNRMLSGLSMKDELTGLYNRLGYHNLGHQLFKEVNGAGERLGILFIDMDRLKLINDTRGHAGGDQAIRCVSNAIAQSLPHRGVPVRFGGDEFLALVPADGAQDVADVAADIEAALPVEAAKLGLHEAPGISIGFVLTDPASGQTLDEYIEAADTLMYQQKREKQTAY